jgi:hypothetical protein
MSGPCHQGTVCLTSKDALMSSGLWKSQTILTRWYYYSCLPYTMVPLITCTSLFRSEAIQTAIDGCIGIPKKYEDGWPLPDEEKVVTTYKDHQAIV